MRLPDFPAARLHRLLDQVETLFGLTPKAATQAVVIVPSLPLEAGEKTGQVRKARNPAPNIPRRTVDDREAREPEYSPEKDMENDALGSARDIRNIVWLYEARYIRTYEDFGKRGLNTPVDRRSAEKIFRGVGLGEAMKGVPPVAGIIIAKRLRGKLPPDPPKFHAACKGLGLKPDKIKMALSWAQQKPQALMALYLLIQ